MKNKGIRGDIKILRREQLIEATMRTIARRGFARTTMAHVAKTAGLSQGIVNFYFKTKEALLYETLVHLAQEYDSIMRQALDRAGQDPVEALEAMILIPMWAQRPAHQPRQQYGLPSGRSPAVGQNIASCAASLGANISS